MARVGSVWRALRRARASVRVRVTLLAAGTFALTLALAAAVLLHRLETTLVDDVRADSEAVLTRQLVTIGERGLPQNEMWGATSTGVVTYYADGRVFSIALPAGMTPEEFNVELTNATGAVSAPNASLQVQAVGGAIAETGSATNDVIATSAPLGPGVVAVASTLDEVRHTIDTISKLLWIVGPILVALVAGLAWVLAGRALRPVGVLTARVASIGSDSLHERVPEPASNDEIATLARTMNEMLGRLDASNEAGKRLVSDASHELRTPIAVMRTELEVARRDAGNDWAETSGALLGELDRLGALVDDLLLLARGQERRLEPQRVDLVDLVHEAASRRRRADVTVDVVIGDGAAGDVGGGVAGGTVVEADRAALQRALDHLVANGARSARSRVVISIDLSIDVAVIHVDDDGPGIPAEHRESVVQRFVRLDDARSRDAGGAGLGLAVASDVAGAHGGALHLDDSPLGGARVSIVLDRSHVERQPHRHRVADVDALGAAHGDLEGHEVHVVAREQ